MSPSRTTSGGGQSPTDVRTPRLEEASLHRLPPRPAQSGSSESANDRRLLGWAIALTVLVALFGLFARLQILLSGDARPATANIFVRLYALHERPFLLLLALSALLTGLVVARWSGGPITATKGIVFRLAPPSGRALAIVAALVFAMTVAVTILVMHGLLFSMDEFGAEFQARIFAAGRVAAPIPAQWRAFVSAIIPVYVTYRPESSAWLSAYLPGYALLKVPFVAMHAGVVLNPIFAATTIVLLGLCARRLWPGEGTRPWLAIALLVTSSQFLMTSGTGYSMPAHLCLNLLWLYLYLRGDQRSWIGALVVGVFALGLHNPFPHALFVAPFLVRLLLERRWRRVGEAALVYAVGATVWLAWLRFSYPPGQSGGGFLSIFAFPAPIILWVNGISLSLLFTWQAPLFGLLALVTILRLRRLEEPLTDLAAGVLLTLGFFLFFPSTQGHGWGHRYAYQVLGSMALLAAAGVGPLITVLGERRAQVLVTASLLVALFVQLPWRALQTEQFVRPFAAGYAYVITRPADVVLVHTDSIWYGRDALRNDPLFHGQPVIVNAQWLTDLGRAEIERKYPGRVVDVTNSELLHLGMTLWLPPRRLQRPPPPAPQVDR
jgi:hypothetical protein